MRKGYVLSDLHLFARRSNAALYQERIENSAAAADFLVLNGDIFDFKWSRLPSERETLEAAADWLARLSGHNPACEIFYVMGNHDALAPLAEKIESLSLPNLRWSPTHFIINSSLFLHGDLPLEGKNPFSRALMDFPKIKGPVPNILYDALTASRAHRGAELFTRKSFLAPRLHRALQGREEMEGVRHVYFGHTHLAFENFRYGGYVFHNTGAAIKGVGKRILPVKHEE